MCSSTGYEPRSSVPASKTGDNTMSGQNLSVVLVLFFGLMSKCVDCFFDENFTLDRMMMKYRHWPEVYDLCHIARCASQRVSRAILAWPCV